MTVNKAGINARVPLVTARTMLLRVPRVLEDGAMSLMASWPQARMWRLVLV
jgi:hypothetical protein